MDSLRLLRRFPCTAPSASIHAALNGAGATFPAPLYQKWFSEWTNLTRVGGLIFHIPTALVAIVPTYNVPEAGSTQLNFTPDDLVGIYLGDIGTWSDPRAGCRQPCAR